MAQGGLKTWRSRTNGGKVADSLLLKEKRISKTPKTNGNKVKKVREKKKVYRGSRRLGERPSKEKSTSCDRDMTGGRGTSPGYFDYLSGSPTKKRPYGTEAHGD